MVVIGYHPMLRHDHSTAGATAQCCVGSTPVRSGAVVHAGHVAGSGHAEAQGQSADGPSLVSPVAPARPGGIEGRGATGPKTAARCPAAGAGRARVAPGTAAPRLPHRSVDAAARGDGHRTLDWRALSRRPCLVHPARAAVVVATSHAPGARAGRVGHSALGGRALAEGKKNARRRRAWLVFEDESGVSQQPVVRRTWAPRGETPILIHTGGHWKRLSIAGALAFRWDGRRTRFFFHTRAGSYTDAALIRFLRDLKRHFPRQRLLLIWDGLSGHTSRVMTAYLARQRAWLTVERLPGYAPDLNPIEQLWGNVKTRELANVCAPNLAALRPPLRAGFARVRRQPQLAFAFLRH